MLGLQEAVKNTTQKVKLRLILGTMGFAVIITSVIFFCSNDKKSHNIMVLDAIELMFEININESDSKHFYTLTVVGYLKGNAYNHGIPPIAFQSFNIMADGTIESVENIILSVYIDGNAKAVKYDSAYAVLEEVNRGK